MFRSFYLSFLPLIYRLRCSQTPAFSVPLYPYAIFMSLCLYLPLFLSVSYSLSLCLILSFFGLSVHPHTHTCALADFPRQLALHQRRQSPSGADLCDARQSHGGHDAGTPIG
jgi:hypothetical protein